MKVICTQENFRRAIFNTERFISKQTTLPILNNILFSATKKGLKLSATNLEMGVETMTAAKIEKEGAITVPARIISNFVNNLPKGETVELESQGQNLKIKSGNYKAIIKGLLADDFPLLPKKEGVFIMKIAALQLKEAINKAVVCVAFNEVRQELTGINLILEEKQLFLAATDSFRLAESRVSLEEAEINREVFEALIKKGNSLIVPASTFLELSRIIQPETDQKVEITIEEGQIFLETEGVNLVSRLINGKYPEYRHIMPENYKTRAVLDKSLFQSVVKMAGVFAVGKTSEIKLKIDPEASKLLVEVESVEAGENVSQVKADVSGPSQEAIFNSKYLLDGLSTVGTSQVALLLSSSSTPAALKEINEKSGEVLGDYTYIVMPIKN